MSQLFRFPSSVRRDPAVEAWMREHAGELGAIARRWFEVMRERGDDVREVLHDGHPTACVGDAAFAYVNAFTAHVNVGFFRGAEIADPNGLLQGTGKLMRHVKLGPERTVDAAALMTLIETAYADMKARLKTEELVMTEMTSLLQAFADAWNRHDLDALMSMMTTDCVFEASAGDAVDGERHEGEGAVRAAYAAVFDQYPDAHWGNARHFVTGDRGVSEWTFTGTRKDGKRVEVTGCDLFTLRNGKIAIKNSFRKNRPPIG